MRIRKMSYRPKLAVLIFVVTIILFANRTIFYITSSIDAAEQAKLQTLKKLAKDESLAKVNRISAMFAPYQQKQIQENFVRFEQIHYDTDNNKEKLHTTKQTQQPTKYGKDSYLKYIEDTNDKDLKDSFVNLHQYDFVLNNKNACNKDVLVLILIHSDPRKYNERNTIRDTWGSVKFYSGANIVPLFLLAQVENKELQDEIVLESDKYLDIVQGNFIDAYRNLTYKCVMGLHWVQKYCNHTKFVVKVDDDTLIDVYHLVRFLLQKSPDGNLENFLYCSIYRNQGPRRTTDDKWFVPESEYPYSKYPPYCEGFAYIMSYDVSKKLYDASKEVKLYWIDDVYVTGFAALKAGVFPRNMEAGHGYDLLESAEHTSKTVQSSMFLLAKYEHLRQNWGKAWNDVKSIHKIK